MKNELSLQIDASQIKISSIPNFALSEIINQLLGIFRSGKQARIQLEAVGTVRPIKQVWVYSIDQVGAQKFVRELAGQGPIPSRIDGVDEYWRQ